jgi:hypothetical protein
MTWLASARPDLLAYYQERYGNRSYLPKSEQQALADLVRDLVDQARSRYQVPRRIRLVAGMDVGDPSLSGRPSPAAPADQLNLGL